MRMSNHNKIRPVDKNNLNGKYKILFSTPQTKNSYIAMEFRGLQIYNSKFLLLKSVIFFIFKPKFMRVI